MRHFYESHGRSILKTLSWKLIATVISFSVTYYETNSLDRALRVSGIIFVIGLGIYYAHERMWNTIHWGKQHNDD